MHLYLPLLGCFYGYCCFYEFLNLLVTFGFCSILFNLNTLVLTQIRNFAPLDVCKRGCSFENLSINCDQYR